MFEELNVPLIGVHFMSLGLILLGLLIEDLLLGRVLLLLSKVEGQPMGELLVVEGISNLVLGEGSQREKVNGWLDTSYLASPWESRDGDTYSKTTLWQLLPGVIANELFCKELLGVLDDDKGIFVIFAMIKGWIWLSWTSMLAEWTLVGLGKLNSRLDLLCGFLKCEVCLSVLIVKQE